MNDKEILSFIKEEMLTDPSADAQFIYMSCNMAQEDVVLFYLLNDWMKANKKQKLLIEKDITDRINILLC